MSEQCFEECVDPKLVYEIEEEEDEEWKGNEEEEVEESEDQEGEAGMNNTRGEGNNCNLSGFLNHGIGGKDIR